MYESFGAVVSSSVDPNGKAVVNFRVFFPNAAQFIAAGQPRIKQIKAVGSFQGTACDPGTGDLLGAVNWIPASGVPLTAASHVANGVAVGTLFAAAVSLPVGFYEYKYWVEFDNGEERWLADPCTQYGGKEKNNSAFVVGGAWPAVVKLKQRRDFKDLVIYELMIDDFAANLVKAGLATQGDAPLEAVRKRVAALKDLGVNAIEFMPWTAWPGTDFSWGYNPAFFFSVGDRYVLSNGRPLDKLALLRELINECHNNEIQVIMDGVFNHADTSGGQGFPYANLYEQEFESPYVGTFSGGGFFTNLDFNNECTHQFVFDVCRYWIEEFGIDGIRFDYTLGFWHGDDRGHGLSRLIFDLRQYLRNKNETNFSLILEHLTDNRYEAINAVNQVGATACWFDPLMFASWRYLERYRASQPEGTGDILDVELLRVLDGTRDFGWGRGGVAYIENHDHSRIAQKAGGRDVWWRTQPYAIALFTGTGTPMLYNGQELGEDQHVPESGDGRVVARPLNWARRGDAPATSLSGLYKKLIAMRLGHPGLRGSNIEPKTQPDWARERDKEGFGVDRNLSVVVFHRWGPDPVKAGEARYVVVLNFANVARKVRFHFPRSGTWEDLLSGWYFPVGADLAFEFTVGSNWGHVFYSAP